MSENDNIGVAGWKHRPMWATVCAGTVCPGYLSVRLSVNV